MTSKTEPTCEPRFPTPAALLDNSALVRFWKCGALDAFADTVNLVTSSQVASEFRKQGPAQRAAFDRLGINVLRVAPSTEFWDEFCRLRGTRCSTRDLGDDETLAIAITRASSGQWAPIVTYDRPATIDADKNRVVTIDFLDTLSWLVGCGRLDSPRADEIEQLAGPVDGWRRPAGYAGQIDSVRPARQDALVQRFGA